MPRVAYRGARRWLRVTRFCKLLACSELSMYAASTGRRPPKSRWGNAPVPVIISSRYHARPGEEAALLANARQLVGSPSNWPTGAREARLFQSLHDPGDLLFLSEWERREAFDSALPSSPA